MASASSSLMATTQFQSTLIPHNRFSSTPHIVLHLGPPLFKPKPLSSFSPLPTKPSKSTILSSSLHNPPIKPPHTQPLSGSTRTVTTLVAVALTASRFFARGLLTLAVQLKEPLLHTAGPAFFAALKDAPTGSLNTPFTVVAAGMAYLNLFRNIIPPIFDTLDVSPLLAFAVLGTLGSILSSSRQAY